MKLPALLTAALAWATLAHADVLLFNQSSPDGNSFDITDYRLADSFKPMTSATLQQVEFWYQAQEQTDLAVVTYAIYADHSGTLGALLDSGTVSGPTAGYDSSSGLFTAVFGVNPLVLSASSTYWLELHAGSALTDPTGFTISWAAVGDTSTPEALMNVSLALPNASVDISGFNQYAFQLSGTPTPEPSALGILSALAFALVTRTVFLRRNN